MQLSTVPSTMALASCAGGGAGDGAPVPRMRGEMPNRGQWRWAVGGLSCLADSEDLRLGTSPA